MRSKRLFAMLLAVCMIISVFSPAASAVKPGENAMGGTNQSEVVGTNKIESSPINNGLIATPKGALSTMRDNDRLFVDVKEAELSRGEGKWTSTEVDMDLNLTLKNEPECIEELKAAAELYGQNDIVAAFVVMEDAPLSERYSSISKATLADEEKLLAVQDKVIKNIEKSVLNGAELEVRYQFTYLTNSFTIRTEFKNLEAIAKMDGVKSVFIMPVYEPCAVGDVMNPNTVSSGKMTGVANVWAELGYTGTGMKIAVIDTGLDLDHPSFAADPETNANSMTVEDIAAVLEDLNAYAYRYGNLSAEDLYYSTKVPYAFNYVDNNLSADHSRDNAGDHGTHVAGIAAANKVEGTNVVGMAPDAQIIVMKVFGANGGAYTDDIVAAVEDAMTLGCDVVNASLGSPAGFASTDTEIDLIYERLSAQDIVATFSAGNEGTSSYGNMWGTDMNRTQNPDNAAVGSPSTYINTLSIASAENCSVMTPYFALADQTKVFFNMSYEWAYGYVVGMNVLIGQELEYVVIDGLGSEADFYDEEGNSLVEGKVAVVQRGDISFGEKIYNAEMAGAVACVIWNNNNTDDIFNFYMVTQYPDGSYPNIPTCLVSLADGQIMKDAEVKTMTVAKDMAPRDALGGQMSSFSSWGVSPDLQLVPDITGIGGNVYSCYDGGVYGLMSGTSMSAPQIAGVTALVMQYLYEKFPNAEEGQIRAIAEALMMSTADPIISIDSEVEASPRQQGAGLVDAYEAVTSESYLTVNGGRPKAELGDSTDGKYSFSFEIHNFSDEAKTYEIKSSGIMIEGLAAMQISATEYEFFMAGANMVLSNGITFDQNEVTVPAGGEVTVNVTIALNASEMATLDYYWENGTYVEGYVYLVNEEGETELNLPFLGFYGDWTEAPVFDTAYWYDNSFFGLTPANGLPEGDEYYHVFWTSLAGIDWVLGLNPYSGPYMDEYGNIAYDPAHNVLSPNGDGVIDGLTEIYLSLLRNAKTLTFTYAVGDEIIHRETVTNVSKTMYRSNYGQVVPWIHSWYFYELYDFAGLENGTEILLTIDATVDYADGGEHSIQIPITIDTEKGVLVDTYEMVTESGMAVLAVEASDNVDVAAIYVMNASGTRVYGEAYDFQMDKTEDGTYIAYFDVTGLGSELTVAVCDYAGNEAYYIVTYEANGENLPQMDTSELYAYRVYDNYIYSDHMYGWVSMNKPASAEEYANLSVWTDDYMEYAAINAAEYVDGKIIAVDAVYNLVILEPGLFDRHNVANIGVNVLDMTFDDSTGTMYVLSKQNYYTYLYSMDILTGELTELKYYGYYFNAPWAIADDDNGTLYAVKYNSSSVFTLDVEGGTYAMTEVTDADGNAIVITNSYGEAVRPSANSQSMTWLDGKLYWAYFREDYYGGISELITIDTETWTSYASVFAGQGYDAEGNLVDYYPVTELVGLLALNETNYKIPESDAAVSIALDAEELILTLGASQSLSVSWLPWNYELNTSDLVWTSSDETVATVSADGTVTTVGEGVAEITVSYGELTASCAIIVVNIEGSFCAYNYYSGDGYFGHMIAVNMETMDYELISGVSPVDFMAGAYNGHDGYFYGYDVAGQLYRYDFTTGEATAIGASIGTYPVDMAYDYNTGMMYALVLNYNTYENTLYAVNMNNGAVMEMATGMGLMNLAISDDGTMYAMNASGYLCSIEIFDYSMYGSGMYMEAFPVMEQSFGDLYLLASMCWDSNNDVLLWNWCESATMVWMDPEQGYAINLGDPTESGVIELTGMFVVPNEIPELEPVAVESVTAEDMLILTGYEKIPAVTVVPFNATSQNIEMTSADTSVVEVTANGTLVAVASGETTITAKLTDEIGGESYEVSFTVTVIDGADNLYAHLLTDITTYDAQAWIELYAGNPSVYDVLGYFDYTIFTQEYYNGKIYTYGYDAMDWTANWQFFVLDAATLEIEKQIDMGEAFPYVYDMTYDYTTSTMYALAGPSEDDTSLYVVNMETGSMTLLMEVEPLLLAIAAGPDGVLYAIENSVATMDWETWMTTLSNANLWAIDPLACELTLIGDTGLKSNMISSMTYDYDTDALYWTPFAQESSYISHLAIIDTETGVAKSLGTIGMAGAQVGGLFTICDEFPEENPNVLHKLLMAKSKVSIAVGETLALDALTMPMNAAGEMIWKSSDKRVVTVDENGVITGVSQGKARITVSITVGDETLSAECVVSVLNTDASFLTYNTTDGGWALINRADTTVVTNLTEGEEVGVVTIASIGTDVYGYDVNNQLFQLNTETYERTNIGEGLGLTVEEGYAFEIRDMAYDAANERILVLGANLMYDPDWDEYAEIYNGCGIYEVDLTTGALELLHTIEEVYYVFAMTVDSNGYVYYYNTFNDEITKLNLADGTITTVINMQTQSLYGDMYCDYAMYYDELTGLIYILFTSNGNFYKMHTVDVVTGELVQGKYVGEIVEEGWYYIGDMFNGLTFAAETIEEHFHVFENGVCECGEKEELDFDSIENPFVDVKEGTYCYESVLWAAHCGIAAGTSLTTFEPNDSCTRAQIVTFLWRAAGEPSVEGIENPFVDLKEGAYYYDAVLWAVENGITAGTTPVTFEPEAKCTREQAVSFLWRAAGKPAPEATETPFKDLNENAYYYEAVLWAVENGITAGYTTTTFAPKMNCTRGQIVTFLYRFWYSE